jgi:hypothetical protein
MNDNGTINCAVCETEVHPLALFPGDICVNCYETQTAHLTPAELFGQIQSAFNPKGK